ncbi:MAG: endopeptidase La [Hydrocarboniphaga sp.]|uniref:Lon protease n=2 Tax=Nevskiaceae TaxID=568386 RepID=I8HZ28_9GAMM|nr:endopeptidase La [Hydrocarboniphaga sp.]EIT68801.1 ATP-dependent protease La [Hydrocarboniphaga effusa AP103]MDZ4076855.1 endopeptidase La [Hydrocarboniphaga sp.]
MEATQDRQAPVLPLRDVVVYPHMAIPLFVGREKSIRALSAAMQNDKRILLVAQRTADTDDPSANDIYRVGTLASILQMLKLPDGTVKVLVEGVQRAQILNLDMDGNYAVADCKPLPVDEVPAAGREVDALVRSTLAQFEQYIKLNKKVPAELLPSLASMDAPGRLADTIAAHLNLKLEDKQQVLEIDDPHARLEHVFSQLESEIDVLQIEKKIRGRVKSQMEKNQREYYLNEQMKAIQKELGEGEDAPNEQEEYARKIEKSGMPKEAKAKAKAELNKLKMMPPMSAEATVVRNYLDHLTTVPWKKATKTRIDLKVAQDKLDEDHHGLEKVKERILEYLAVQSRVKKLRGPILCLVGPPGVGKTSLGRSIAEAVNRKFVRMSLGGVRDEAEIRGHRRTYIGAMPGKIVQNLTKVGVKNPLFLLDEIDKMSMDFRGDPSAALLEVLDPEQNSTFNDHYLDVDLDLSDVMFVATANTLNIPGPLLDRMEVIRLSGYTEDEKLNIAKQYLIPKQLKNNGLKAEGELEISDAAIRALIRHYTREAGVRNLEREISKVARKVVKEVLLKPTDKALKVTDKNLDKYLGVQKFRYGRAEEKNQIGQVTGLAWTEVGGELLSIEAALSPGKGKLTQTGSLGNVMQESIQAALTVVRSRARGLGIDPSFHQSNDIHVHVPEGATPKDGPSAGVAMCTAMVSALTGIPVRADVAMTGEITLRGEVLPIGGLKEKLLAAQRGGIRTVVIPHENVKDLADIPPNIKKELKIEPVRWIEDVLKIALESMPEPKSAETPSPVPASQNDLVRPH